MRELPTNTSNGKRYQLVSSLNAIPTQMLMAELTQRLKRDRLIFRKMSSELMDQIQFQLIDECGFYLRDDDEN